MELPKLDPNEKVKTYCKLNKVLYDLKQSGKA